MKICLPLLLLALLCTSCSKETPQATPQTETPAPAAQAAAVPELVTPPPAPKINPTAQVAATTAKHYSDAELAAFAAPGKNPVHKAPFIGAIAIDADSGKVLLEENADALALPASMVKMMLLLLTQESIDQGRVSLSDTVAVSERAMKMGGSQVYLDVRESFPLEDMLYALIIQSANDAAVAIAEHVAGSPEAMTARMNQKARQLGMVNTRFSSVHGLPAKTESNDVTTPRDMAILAAELCKHPEIFRYTGETYRQLRANTDKPFDMRTHNPFLQKKVAGCDGLKTGYTRRAGYSIAVTVSRAGSRVILVGMGFPDKATRDSTLNALMNQAWIQLSQ